MKLRVATYNIHKGVTGLRGRPRIHDVRGALHAIDADLVFLQEVQDRNDRLLRHAQSPRTNQLAFLATDRYSHHAYGMNAVYPHGHHGNAILSRYTIETHANHDISDHMLESRGLLHAVVHLGRKDHKDHKDHKAHLICVHLGLIKRSRVRQAQFLIDFAQREIPPAAPLIVAGDFNDWQRRVDPLLCEGLRLIEVGSALQAPPRMLDRLLPWRKPPAPQPARTFPAFAPWLTLDRIYVRGFEVLRTEVPRGVAWARRSDHAPLIAELKLR
jgi:endonuclease/exonuclease/phosphatase family metal-dependent hydrolase